MFSNNCKLLTFINNERGVIINCNIIDDDNDDDEDEDEDEDNDNDKLEEYNEHGDGYNELQYTLHEVAFTVLVSVDNIV